MKAWFPEIGLHRGHLWMPTIGWVPAIANPFQVLVHPRCGARPQHVLQPSMGIGWNRSSMDLNVSIAACFQVTSRASMPCHVKGARTPLKRSWRNKWQNWKGWNSFVLLSQTCWPKPPHPPPTPKLRLSVLLRAHRYVQALELCNERGQIILFNHCWLKVAWVTMGVHRNGYIWKNVAPLFF